MRIGLMGFEFEASNKGCEALSYSVLPILTEMLKDQKIEILNFWRSSELGKLPEMYPEVKFTGLDIKLKSVSGWKELISGIRSCDVILDITHGDSFSDIYGRKWFARTTLVKQLVQWLGVPLILMPQTYGPFENKLVQRWALHVIAGSDRIYCRDEMSYRYLEQKLPEAARTKLKSYTDLAFALPYNALEPKVENGKIKVGVNISGLLWHNCETDNHLGLKVDYHQYCRMLLNRLLDDGNYAVTLIPHVICDGREGENYYENDCRAIRELLKEFPQCDDTGVLETAVDVKSFIATQDVFTGARMHATIGAFSSGVACIPFAYSRKFEGLYRDLNYHNIVDGKALSTDEAVEKTMELIQQHAVLKAEATCGMTIVWEKLRQFREDFSCCVLNRG